MSKLGHLVLPVTLLGIVIVQESFGRTQLERVFLARLELEVKPREQVFWKVVESFVRVDSSLGREERMPESTVYLLDVCTPSGTRVGKVLLDIPSTVVLSE